MPQINQPQSAASRAFFIAFKVILWLGVVSSAWYTVDFVTTNVLGKPWSWQFTEMLINYQGGFTRRGLLGEIFFWISSVTGVQPQYLFAPVCIAAAVYSVAFLIVKMRRRGIEWWIAATPLLFGSCCECLMRKDFIIFTIFIGILCIFRSDRLGAAARIVSITLLCLLSLIIYEPAFFIFMPVLGLLMWRDDRMAGHRWLLVVAYATVIAAMGWLLTVIGSEAKALAINDSWHRLFPGLIDETPSASIAAIAWNIGDSLQFNDSVLLDPLSGNKAALLLLLPMTFYIYSRYIYVAVRRGAKPVADRGTWVLLLLTQALSLLPLWLGLSCDYGRMCMYVFFTSMTICLTLGEQSLNGLFSERLQALAERCDRQVGRILPCNIYVMCTLLLVSVLPFSRITFDTVLHSSLLWKIQYLSWQIKTLIVSIM